MGNFYRVSVENEDGATVLELMAPAEMLRQFAPEAVARLLREATPQAERDSPAAPKFTDAEPVRRKRRTKAEMAEAQAAERLADPNSLDEAPDQAAPAPVINSAVDQQSAYKPFG